MVTAALARGRMLAESLMTSRWTIRRATGESSIVDFRPVQITEQVYDGIGKLQTYEAYEQSGTAGPATTQTQRMTLHLPVGSYMPHPGDIATCTASSDPLLVGRRMRIAQVMPSKEHATAYRCFVDETTQGA